MARGFVALTTAAVVLGCRAPWYVDRDEDVSRSLTEAHPNLAFVIAVCAGFALLVAVVSLMVVPSDRPNVVPGAVAFAIGASALSLVLAIAGLNDVPREFDLSVGGGVTALSAFGAVIASTAMLRWAQRPPGPSG